MIDNIKDFIEEKHYEYTFNEWLKKQIFARDKEIERLNNIINELEKYCNKEYKEWNEAFRSLKANHDFINGQRLSYIGVLNKIKELKEHK